jgi:hypothetical protein
MGVSLKAFAHDIQLYLHYKPSATSAAVSTLKHYIAVINLWMAAYYCNLCMRGGEKTDEPALW